MLMMMDNLKNKIWLMNIILNIIAIIEYCSTSLTHPLEILGGEMLFWGKNIEPLALKRLLIGPSASNWSINYQQVKNVCMYVFMGME